METRRAGERTRTHVAGTTSEGGERKRKRRNRGTEEAGRWSKGHNERVEFWPTSSDAK